MLVRCLYASRTAKPLTPDVVDSILAQSSSNNPPRGITGILVYTNDVFVQVIEGGRDDVGELFNSIVRDPRHTQVRLLSFEEIAERRFGNWTMGKVNVDRVNPALLLKYSERAELNPFACSSQATMALLSELVATGAILGKGSG